MSDFPGKQHVVAPPSDPRPQAPIPSPGHERSTGAAPLDTDVLEWLDILWRHLDDRWQVAFRSGHQKVLARLFERSAGAAPLDVEVLRRAMYSLNMYGSAFALAEAYARLSEGTDR